MLDEKGFKRKRFDDLIDEMEDKSKEAYGDRINTSALSPLGIFLRIVAWFLAILYALAEKVYYSGYVNTAEGVSLDRLGPHVGVSRILAQYAVGNVTLTGTPGYTVAAGFLVSTDTDIQYETTSDATFPASGSMTVPVEAMEAGLSGNTPEGTVTIIVNPVPEVTAVNNPAAILGGRDKETDPEFRDKFSLSVAGGGSATGDAIRGAVLRVTGVRAAAVIINNKITPDAAGRPAKSYQVYALGGSDTDIANAILSVGAAGIESYGDISMQVKDLSGNLQPIKFSRAVVVPVHIKIQVYKSTSYPSDGDDQVKSKLVRFIGGADLDGTVYAGLSMGEDVVMMRLAAAAYSIVGVEDVVIELSTNGTSYGPHNLVVDVQQVAQTAANWIEVTHHDFSG
ncbi:baseplate J/gp47 family protein [Paenibacillus sp. EKM211P]|uniref:baseplate J/gp47 family protein n=1 Tax=Paenibacillus sp. EKM211P TaxID=1683679 RepID=UPI0013E971BB|nr:baseplate J/gp47 family protein [Paenibacillus sp. EKM211P]KAF6585006.1 baseplate J/gp47 family protein [Paenibacillus sp. EKM211P]